MTRKRESVLLLLGSLRDYDPPLGSMLRTSSGLGAAARKPCPDCGHTTTPGWRVDSFRRRTPCQSCGGSSEPSGAMWRQRDAGRGWVHYDPMDTLGRPIQTADTTAPPTRPARMVTCDACAGTGTGPVHLRELDDPGSEYREPCRYCGGGGKVERRNLTELRLRDPVESGDPLTVAIQARDEAGDYHALEWALARLTGRQRRLLLDVHGPNPARPPASLTVREAGLLERALTLVEARMPERPRVPGGVRTAARRKEAHLRKLRGHGTHPAALAQRDKEIRRLVRTGKPRQWVAAEFGLSVRQVGNVVNGEKREAA